MSVMLLVDVRAQSQRYRENDRLCILSGNCNKAYCYLISIRKKLFILHVLTYSRILSHAQYPSAAHRHAGSATVQTDERNGIIKRDLHMANMRGRVYTNSQYLAFGIPSYRNFCHIISAINFSAPQPLRLSMNSNGIESTPTLQIDPIQANTQQHAHSNKLFSNIHDLRRRRTKIQTSR